MNKCNSLSDVTKLTDILLKKYRIKKQSVDELKKAFNELYNDIGSNDALENIDEISAEILNRCSAYGVVDLSSDFFNVDKIKRSILQIKRGVLIDPSEASTERLTDANIVNRRVKANFNFIDLAYGAATQVANFAQRGINQNICDLLFINRGSIDEDLTTPHNQGELNYNICRYHNILAKRIGNYLLSKISESKSLQQTTSRGLKEFLKNPDIYSADSKVLEEFYNMVDTYLSSTTMIEEELKKLYNNMISDNVSGLEKQSAKLRLEAYNAAVFFKHFDTYLALTFPKIIKIKDFGVKTGANDKYEMSETSTNLLTSWRRSENIDTEAEADQITLLFITTTPIYTWQSNTPVNGQFLEFADFERMVTKIKDLSFNSATLSVIFNDKYIAGNTSFWKSLSANTLLAIKGKSLAYILSTIRRNPVANIPTVFEVISNPLFFDLDNNRPFFNKLSFTLDDLNKIYSITKGIFGPNHSNSLYNLSNGNKFFAYITLTADSLSSVNYTQYYEDENGIQLRTLTDLTITNLSRAKEEGINASHTIRKIKDWDSYKKFFDFNTKKDVLETKKVSFTLPLASKLKVRITVGLSRGTVSVLGASFDLLFSDSLIQRFISSYTRTNVYTDPNLYNALLNIYGLSYEMNRALFNMAAKILANQYVSKEIVDDPQVINKSDTTKTIFSSRNKFDKTVNELNLISSEDVPTLKRIAQAMANTNGLTSVAQVKDGLGKSLSKYSFSRLLGNLHTLFELLEKAENSATRSSIFLNSPGLFDSIFTSKEYQSIYDENKPTTLMSSSELIYSNFMYDFLAGLSPMEGLLGNGKVSLLPSVNSDKNTIGKALFNLNTVIGGKPLKEYTNEELANLTKSELGTLYTNIANAVREDWSAIDRHLGNTLPFSLATDYFHGFIQFNTWCALNEISSPARWLKQLVREYNVLHRLHPLALIDQIHYKVDKQGRLAINNTVLAQLAKYNPTYLKSLGVDVANFPTFSQFFANKKVEMIKSLLKSNTDLILQDGVHQWLREKYPEWVSNSGKLIYAKIGGVNVTSDLDLITSGYSGNLNQWRDNLQVNPLLEKYMYLEGLLTQEYMACTVGTFLAHPPKGKFTNVIEEEAAQFNAQHKRNVSFTAAVHEFLLNLLDGITEDYNIAIVDDIKDQQGLITGNISSIKPFDGATFVNPFNVLLENLSLGGAKAGITKKQFVHFKDERTAVGGIIKTAGFGITNNWIRNSKFFQNMMRKMTDHVWLNEDGSQFFGDITYNFNKLPITFTDNVYFEQNGHYYLITGLKFSGIHTEVTNNGIIQHNTYIRTLLEISQTGTEIGAPIQDTVNINSNYQLWQALGGANSVSYEGRLLKPSENSIKLVVNFMNNVGAPKQGHALLKTLDDVWLPLKHVDVHYVVTAGAIKQGGANINSAARYTDDIPYDILKIHMYQSGIQLDKEHQADSEDISLMTQVISACAAKGYTFKLASQVYQALSRLTEVGIREHLQPVLNLFKEGQKTNLSVLGVVIKTIVDNIGNGRALNFAERVANDLKAKASKGEIIQWDKVNIPLSDNQIYAKLFSTLTVAITRAGIKEKIPGLLAVLTPSHNIMRLYAGRKLESFKDFDSEIDALQAILPPLFDGTVNNITNLELNRRYLITDIYGKTESKLIRTPKEYVDLKRAIRDGLVTYVVEDLKAGRDLAGYNVRFQTSTGETFLLYDLDSYRKKFDCNELRERAKKIDLTVHPNFTGQMALSFNGLKRPDIVSDTTFGAILEGKRTATTRYMSDSNMGYWSHLKVGDIVQFNSADGRSLYVRVTKPLTKLRDNTSAATWCKKEGWSEEFFNKLKQSERWKSGAYLFEYLLISEGEAMALTNTEATDFLTDVRVFYQDEIGYLPQITLGNVKELLKTLATLLQRNILRDLAILSPSLTPLIRDYEQCIQTIDPSDQESLYDLVNYVNILLEEPNGTDLIVNGQKIEVTPETFATVEPIIRQLLSDASKIRINGLLVDVNKKSLKTLPYEVILPKTFKTAFDLDTYVSLQEIEQDPEYFVKKYNQNRLIPLQSNQFDLALKTTNGHHIYLLDSNNLPNTLLLELEISEIFENGKRYRTDIDGNILYEMNIGDKVYRTINGDEIIVTDNFASYLRKIDYDSIQISDNQLQGKYGKTATLTKILDALSKTKKARRYYQFINSDNVETIHQQNEIWNLEVVPGSYLYNELRGIHTSFLKSLQVIASRTPSQSMQSFMPMKVVAFDNPDINNAFVSTYLLLLQGSKNL